MSYQPISRILPQYEDYANWWLKAYEQGTTTPKVMGDDSTPSNTFAKLELDAQGFPNTSGGARLIPWIDDAFDLWIFPTEAEADANDTTNAIQISDNIGQPTDFQYPTNIPIYFATVAAMQAATYLKSGMVVRIGERANSLWDVIAATTNNGYDILDGTASGVSLQLKISGEIKLSHLGDPSSGDVSALFARAVAIGEANKIPVNAEAYEMTWNGSGLSIDIAKTNIIGDGYKITFSSLTTPFTFLTISNSEADVNKRGIVAATRPVVSGGWFVGPGKATASVRFAVIDDAVNNSIWGVRFENGGVHGFSEGVDFVNGAFMGSNKSFHWISCGYAADIQSATNAGERNLFLDSTFTNSDEILKQSNSNASTFFIGCSLDYTPRMVTVTAGDVFIQGSHIESNLDTNNWFHVSGANSLIQVTESAVVLNNTSADLTFSPFYTDSTATNGGIVLDNISLWTNSTYTVDSIIDGTGMASVGRVKYFRNSKKPPIGEVVNLTSYGGFESASFTNDFTTSGTTPPVQDATTFNSGANSLKFEHASASSASNLIYTVSAEPGDYIVGSFYYKTTIATQGATFLMQVEYRDKAGTSIGTNVRLNTTSDVGSFTKFEFAPLNRAPKGTAEVRLLWSLFNTSTGTANAWIDDLIINKV